MFVSTTSSLPAITGAGHVELSALHPCRGRAVRADGGHEWADLDGTFDRVQASDADVVLR